MTACLFRDHAGRATHPGCIEAGSGEGAHIRLRWTGRSARGAHK